MNQEEYLGKLNPQQRAAVEYCDGPQLVIAGAGSGKTRVLTYKIVHLLAQGYEPWRILALTFTNKAAREMRERIQALVGEKVASSLCMGTFHSIFARILMVNAERLGFKSSFTIYDAADSKALIKLIIKDMELDDMIYKPSTVQNAISWAKNALISPEDYADSRELMAADARNRRSRMWEIYRNYRDRCAVAALPYECVAERQRGCQTGLSGVFPICAGRRVSGHQLRPASHSQASRRRVGTAVCGG